MSEKSCRRIRFYLKVVIAIRESRTGENLTYEVISNATGVSSSTLSHMATNQQRRVDLSVLERLCDFFGCELSNLMRLEPAEE